MALPSSGTISAADFNTVLGRAAGTSISLSFIKSKTKAGQESNSFSGYYGKEYYAKTNTSPADAQMWLQNNCNCAANCACACVCNSSCFLAGARVLMADGELRPIELVKIGEEVIGRFGEINTVLALDRPRLGTRPIVFINDDHATTKEHTHFAADGTPVYLDLGAWEADKKPGAHPVIIDEAGTVEYRTFTSFTKTKVSTFGVGTHLIHINGIKPVGALREDVMPPTTQLFNLVLDGSHTMFVNGYLVGGFITDTDFDYVAWRPL